MSIKRMAEAWEAELPAREKCVLLALADSLPDEVTTFSRERMLAMAAKTRFSESASRFAFNELVRMGLFERISEAEWRTKPLSGER